MSFIDHIGGRKNTLGYLFLFCSTFLCYAAMKLPAPIDWIGLATVIGAIATGVFGLVWGNVKEHQSKTTTS